MKHKVLYIASFKGFSTSRLPRKIDGVANSFRLVGSDVYVISGGDILPNKLNNENFFYRNRLRLWKNPLTAFLYHSYSEWKDIKHDRKLRKILEEIVHDYKPDLIWERSSRLHISGLQVAKKYHIPYISEWIDNVLSLYGWSLFKPLGMITEENKTKYADFIVVVSNVLVDYLSEKKHIDKNKFIVSTNAVDTNEFSPSTIDQNLLRMKFEIPVNSFVIVYVGSYAFYHNVRLLIEAANKIVSEFNISKIFFLMVGDGQEKSTCIDLVKKYGIEKFFGFVDKKPQDEIPEILNMCDLAILPDCLEIICPIKVQEYMAMGLPVILPRYKANQEIVEDNVTGIFFDPKDATDLAIKISGIISRPDIAKGIGIEARKMAVNKFTWEKTWGKALLDIFDRLEIN